jgi:predicted RNA binding protein YcfA (HicA-like mRNA interferase family)
VKRRELIRQLERAGCMLVRHGARHDIYRNPATGQQQPVPRHDDVDDDLAKHIKKFLGLQVS